jgi:micrococcal nuclease
MKRLRNPRAPRFRSPRRPGRPRRGWLLSWWNVWRVPTLVTIVAAVWWFGIRPLDQEEGWVPVTEAFSLCGSGERTPGCVIDGDTLLMTGGGVKPRRIRLVGFDTPELEGACPAEEKLAREARQMVAQWLSQGTFEWSGGAEPAYDQYGRQLRAIRRTKPDGSHEYLAYFMIEAGLADESGWGAADTDWCARSASQSSPVQSTIVKPATAAFST